MLETFRGRSEYVIITDVIYSGSDISMIEKYHDEAKSKNQEGIMINLNDSMYEFKRTKVLLKCKTFLDCDAYIDDVIEGTGKNTGRVGAFACHFEDESGETIYFEVGSGFTDEDRINFWADKEKLIGRVCEVKYFEMTVNKEGSKSIRFPVFKTLKEEGTRPHNFEALF
jgi:DNA ligase-1